MESRIKALYAAMVAAESAFRNAPKIMDTPPCTQARRDAIQASIDAGRAWREASLAYESAIASEGVRP